MTEKTQAEFIKEYLELSPEYREAIGELIMATVSTDDLDKALEYVSDEKIRAEFKEVLRTAKEV